MNDRKGPGKSRSMTRSTTSRKPMRTRTKVQGPRGRAQGERIEPRAPRSMGPRSPFSPTRMQRTAGAPMRTSSPSIATGQKVTRAVKRATNAAIREAENVSEYPMRINKYLAQKGYATRKGADELVEKHRVLINNKIAVLGDKVLETDTVEVRTDKKGVQKKMVYFAYNKPRDVITHSPQRDEKEIRDLVPGIVEDYAVFPVGRLDKDSHGLIILTNDGRITDRLLNPAKSHDKEYVVHTKSKLRGTFKEHAERGVTIEGEETKPTKVRILSENSFAIALTEGKKHQIRRMVVALFNEVTDLERIRIMNITLQGLPMGKYRAIEGDELSTFLKSLGL